MTIRNLNAKEKAILKEVSTGYNLTDLKNRIILEINSYVIELTGRRPIIIPMILTI